MNTTQLGQNALDVACSANFGHHEQRSLVYGDCNKIGNTSVRGHVAQHFPSVCTRGQRNTHLGQV